MLLLGISTKADSINNGLTSNLLENLILKHFDSAQNNESVINECYEKFEEGFPVAVKKAKLQYMETGKLTVPQPRLSLGNSFDINAKDLFTKTLSVSYDKRIVKKPKITATSKTPASYPFGFSLVN